MLKGEKVLLRPVRKTDLENFLKWFNDPEVAQYLAIYLPMTDIGEEKWIEGLSTLQAGKEIVFVIEACGDDSFVPIGNCGLHRINWKDRDAEAGMAIGEKDYWGKGYGTEALELLLEYGFDQLNLHRVSTGAYEFNERSIRTQQKAGFQIEGRIRLSVFKNGRYWDKVLLGILREEWLKKK